MKRILVTGSASFVGARVMEAWRDRYALITYPRGWLRQADEDAVRASVMEARPDAILHLAAISDLGTCERNPEAAWRANVSLVEWMCRAARDCGARIVAFSSDQVYNGRGDSGPFREEDVKAASVYARTKLEAEGRGLDILPEAVFLRATWMYDLPLFRHANRGNLLVELLRAATRNEPTARAVNEMRGITYVRQVVENLEQAMALPGGAYNYGSENALNMYDTACDFLRALGLENRIPEVLIRDEDTTRPDLRMDCSKLRRHGIAFDTTEQGVRRCIRDYNLSI